MIRYMVHWEHTTSQNVSAKRFSQLTIGTDLTTIRTFSKGLNQNKTEKNKTCELKTASLYPGNYNTSELSFIYQNS